jgi:outer membrane receptor protein involved in Fe transport
LDNTPIQPSDCGNREDLYPVIGRAELRESTLRAWTVEFRSVAAFGQTGVPVGARWKFIAGARYTDDEVDYVHNRTTVLTGPAIAASFSAQHYPRAATSGSWCRAIPSDTGE